MRALLSERDDPILHIDPPYPDDAEASTAPEGVKILLKVFAPVDLLLVGAALGGEEANAKEARAALFELLDFGADAVQTSRLAEVRVLVDE